MPETCDTTMPFLHLTEDATGLSHFSDASVPLRSGGFAPPAPPMPISSLEPATGLLYLTLPAGWGGAQHRSPRRQVAFCLSGRLRVQAGDGDARRPHDDGHRGRGRAPCHRATAAAVRRSNLREWQHLT